MAYTLANLQTDIRNYTEVSDTVLTDAVLERIIKNAEHTIFRAVDVDNERLLEPAKMILQNPSPWRHGKQMENDPFEDQFE